MSPPDDTKTLTNDARYEMNALVQRRTGLKGIEQLPHSIANLTNPQLNASLNAIARRYGRGEWMQLLSPGGRSAAQARGPEILVAKLTGQRAEQVAPQVRSKLTTALNVGAKTLTGVAPFSSGKPTPTQPQAKNYANRALAELIAGDARFAKFRGKVDNIEQLAYYSDAGPLWSALNGKLQGRTEGHYIAAKTLLSDAGRQQVQAHAATTPSPASPQQVKHIVNARLMKMITDTKFEGKVFGLDSLLNYGDKEVAALLGRLEPVARGSSSHRLGVRDLLAAGSAPRAQRVNDALKLRDLKALNRQVDEANAEVARNEQEWGELSQTKNALQAAGDVVLGLFGDGDGFARYDKIRTQLDAVHRQFSEGGLTYAQASTKVKTLVADYRESHRRQVRGFGDRAGAGATVLTGIKNVAPTAGALLIGSKTNGSPLGALLAGTYSYGTRTSQDYATWWVYNKSPWAGRYDPDTKVHAPKPDAQSNARNLLLASGDAVMATTFAKAPGAIAAGKLSFNGAPILSTPQVLGNTLALSGLTALPTSLLSTAVDQRFNQATQEKQIAQTKADLDRWKRDNLQQQQKAFDTEQPQWLHKQAVLFENDKLAAQKQQAMSKARADLASAPPDQRQAALTEIERRLDQQISRIYTQQSAKLEAQRGPARERAQRHFSQQQTAAQQKLTKILDAKAEVVNFRAQAALEQAQLNAPLELTDQAKRHAVSLPISYGVGWIAGFLPQSKASAVTKWTDPVKSDPLPALADSAHGAFSGFVDTAVQGLVVDGKLPDRQTLIQAAINEAFELPFEAGAARDSLNRVHQEADQALNPQPPTPTITQPAAPTHIPGLSQSSVTPAQSTPLTVEPSTPVADVAVQPVRSATTVGGATSTPRADAASAREAIQEFAQVFQQYRDRTIDETTLNRSWARATEAFSKERAALSDDDKSLFRTTARDADVLLTAGRSAGER
jgi:hypothetical protein